MSSEKTGGGDRRGAGATDKTSRHQRLARELRSNLQKRKALARQRDAASRSPAPANEEPESS